MRSNWIKGLVLALATVLLATGVVSADQIPANCNATGLQFTTVREKTLVTLGEVNRYTVSVTNDDNPGAGSLACDVEDILVIFCCPGLDGHAPNESPGFDPDNPGPLCTVLSDGFGDGTPTDRDDFPANFGTRTYTTQECTIGGFFISGSSKRANVKIQGGFDDLQYGLLHDVPGESPLNREDVLGVTVTECAVQVDKAVSCDGSSFVDMTLVSNNNDGTNGCYGWNAFDSDGNGSIDMSAEDLDIRYRVSNISDAGQALFNCTIDESNSGIINVPVVVGDLADGQTSDPTDIPGSCSESLDDGEPDTAGVTCFCLDPNSPDFDPGVTATASDTATFDCQTPVLNIIKDCASPDANGVDDITIDVSNDGTADLINCTVTDEYYDSPVCGIPGAGTTVALAPAGPFNLNAGGSAGFTGAVTVLQDSCNRATVTCQIADENGQPVLDGSGQPKTITNDDDDLCEPPDCMVEVDKQISCDGGVTWLDQGLGTSNDDGNNIPCAGWNSFVDDTGATVPAEEILVRYVAHNDSAITLYDCTLLDSNPGLNDPGAIGDLNPGETQQFFFPDGSGAACSDDLAAQEPDTATLSCFCSDQLNPDFKTSATDGADFECQTPGLEVIKVCGEPNNDTGMVDFDIFVSNTGDADLENCVISDEIFLDDPTCPAGPAGAGADLTVVPDNIPSLPSGSGTEVAGGTTDCPTAGPACNTATVTCEIVGSYDPATGGQKTITQTADDLCQPCGDGCLTRTPGFWGTHPHITERFLPLQNCGIEINNTFAATAGSSAEDMCWGGRDFKGADTSSSQLQLIRQCMAAHLNIAATTAGAGNCDAAYPNITGTINSCCEDLCTLGPTGGDISDSSCIGLLDAFNNMNDTLDPFGDFISPGPADSSECREANGNGYVNPGRNLGPRR